MSWTSGIDNVVWLMGSGLGNFGLTRLHVTRLFPARDLTHDRLSSPPLYLHSFAHTTLTLTQSPRRSLLKAPENDDSLKPIRLDSPSASLGVFRRCLRDILPCLELCVGSDEGGEDASSQRSQEQGSVSLLATGSAGLSEQSRPRLTFLD